MLYYLFTSIDFIMFQEANHHSLLTKTNWFYLEEKVKCDIEWHLESSSGNILDINDLTRNNFSKKFYMCWLYCNPTIGVRILGMYILIYQKSKLFFSYNLLPSNWFRNMNWYPFYVHYEHIVYAHSNLNYL